MIFEYFRKRREANAIKIREAEARILETNRKHREDAKRIVESHNRSRSTYRDSSYTPSTYSSYDTGSYSSCDNSSYSDSSSSSCDSSSSSCDSGGGGCD